MSAELSVSIVINTDGRRDALEKTLQSLTYLDYSRFEAVVVCGPTQDGTAELVERYRGAVKIAHCPERNLSMSRNIGIGMAAGDLVAFIDDDAFPEVEWLGELAAGYDDEAVGGVGGRVYDHTGWNFQYGYAMADRLGNSWGHLPAPAHEYNFPLSEKYPYIQGTNASFRRSALLQIGGFDEEFAYYLDETDVCCRMVDSGYRLRQLPNAYVHHKFLPSHIRNVNRVVKDKFEIIKNKIYFSIMNNHRHHMMDAVMRDNCAFIDGHLKELETHAAAGRAAWSDVERFREDVERAWVVGLTRALSGERRLLRRSRAAALQEEFLPFPRICPDGGRKVFCFISNEYAPLRIGGIGTYTAAAAQELAGLGHHVHVLTGNRDGNTVDFEHGVWVHRIKSRQIYPVLNIELGIPSHIWNFSATMREELFRINGRRTITAVEAPIWDVEGVAVVAEGIFPCATSLHTTLKVWLDTHHDRVSDEGYMSSFGYPELALEKYMLLQSDGIHANSRSIVDVIYGYSGLRPSAWNLKVIHHGVRDPGPGSGSNGRGQSAARPLSILFVGRLERRKGIDVLFEALEILHARGVGAICDVVGDETVPWDGQASFVKDYAHRLAPHIEAGRIHIRGKVSPAKLDEFFRTADVLVVPSRYESFGLTVIEGFAYGKVVVGARTGGIAEVIDDGRTGRSFESDDHESLASILEWLAGAPGHRNRLALAARSEFDARFRGRRMARDMAEFFTRFERRFIPPSELRFSGNVKNGVSLRGNEIGYKLEYKASLEFHHDGKPLFLHFWCHAWSGIVRVSCAGEIVEEWDLYSEEPRFKTFLASDLGSGAIEVKPSGRRNPKSKGGEVIFYASSAVKTEDPDILRGLYSRRALAQEGRSKGNPELLVRASDMTFGDAQAPTPALWGNEVGVALLGRNWIEFDAFSEKVRLEFWRHPGSGIVAATHGGEQVAEWDLYSESPGLFAVSLDLPEPGRVRLQVTGRKSDLSRGAEAILYRAYSLLPKTLDLGAPVLRYFETRKADSIAAAAAPAEKTTLESLS